VQGRVVLAARFLGYLAGKLNGSASTAASGSGSSSGSSGRSASPAAKAGTPSHEGNILQCAWAAFNQQFLAAAHTDVHALTARLDAALRTEVLCSYYDALVVLEHSGGLVPALPTPKLLALAEQGETEIFAVFGGQGTNEVSLRAEVERGAARIWGPNKRRGNSASRRRAWRLCAFGASAANTFADAPSRRSTSMSCRSCTTPTAPSSRRRCRPPAPCCSRSSRRRRSPASAATTRTAPTSLAGCRAACHGRRSRTSPAFR
jgi:hypothetical protein